MEHVIYIRRYMKVLKCSHTMTNRLITSKQKRRFKWFFEFALIYSDTLLTVDIFSQLGMSHLCLSFLFLLGLRRLLVLPLVSCASLWVLAPWTWFFWSCDIFGLCDLREAGWNTNLTDERKDDLWHLLFFQGYLLLFESMLTSNFHSCLDCFGLTKSTLRQLPLSHWLWSIKLTICTWWPSSGQQQ